MANGIFLRDLKAHSATRQNLLRNIVKCFEALKVKSVVVFLNVNYSLTYVVIMQTDTFRSTIQLFKFVLHFILLCSCLRWLFSRKYYIGVHFTYNVF